MAAAPKWRRVEQKLVTHEMEQWGDSIPLCVVLLPNGKTFSGSVAAVTGKRIDLANGEVVESIFYDSRVVRFIMIEPPAPQTFRLGESQLPLG